MDTFAKVYLAFLIVGFLGAIVGFYILSKKGADGSVLVVAVFIYLGSWLIPPNNSRELHGLEGFLRMTGFFGGILGVFDLLRAKRGARRADAAVLAKFAREGKNSNLSGQTGEAEQGPPASDGPDPG